MKHGFYKFSLQGECRAYVVDDWIILKIRPENLAAMNEVAKNIRTEEIEYILSSRHNIEVPVVEHSTKLI